VLVVSRWVSPNNRFFPVLAPAIVQVGINPFAPTDNGDKGGNPHESLYWRQGAKRAFRKGDMKVVRQGSAWEFYNLSQDISEKNELGESKHALLNELVKEWEELDAQMVDAAFR
jgi:hypothetical protein